MLLSQKLAKKLMLATLMLTGEIIGASRQGTYIDYEKYPKRGTFKGIDQNSSTRSAWYFDIGQPENVRFFGITN